MFTKLVRIFSIALLLGAMIAGSAQAATIESTTSISGTITYNSVGLKGVVVTIQGTALSATTDSLGNYHISYVPLGSSGSIVPALSNFSFTPTSIAFTNIQAALTAKNFTATEIKPVYYSISGKITFNGNGLSGVLVTFGTASTTTNTSGAYTIANILNFTKGRIVPKLAGYVFTPSYISVSSLQSNLINENFTAAQVFTISGKITEVTTLLPVGGVTVSFGIYHAISSATTGAYTIRNIPAGTSGVLTPSLAGKTFTPATITLNNVQANMHAENFVAAP